MEDDKKLKLMFLIPMEGTIIYESAMSIVNLFLSLKESGIEFIFYTVSGSAHAFARNALFRKAIEQLKVEKDFTHIILLDSDHTFDPTDVTRLIQNKEEFGTDIVGAAYLTKSDPVSLVALRATEYDKDDPALPTRYALIRQFELHKMYAVDAIGFGMVVMKPEVLQKMVDYYGTTELCEFKYHAGIVVGEDVIFCQKAKKLGMTIDVSTDVVLGHMTKGTMNVDYAMKVHNTDMIGTVSIYPKMIENTPKEEGWLTNAEGETLKHYAQLNSGGNIVEIGSWKGKSTIQLAQGSMIGNKEYVIAIDPHTGSIEHNMTLKDNEYINTFPEFMKNIKDAGVSNQIIVKKMTSEEAALEVNSPVGTIFIDGDHSYNMVKKDFEMWYPKIIPNGVVMFHDTTTWPGPKQLVEELKNDFRLKYIETRDSLAVFRKQV